MILTFKNSVGLVGNLGTEFKNQLQKWSKWQFLVRFVTDNLCSSIRISVLKQKMIQEETIQRVIFVQFF